MSETDDHRCWKIDALAAVCAAAWLGLTVGSWFQSQISIALPLVVLAIAWAATIVAFRISKGIPTRRALVRIWLWAIVFRGIGLFAVPVFEDDYFRYVWDGFVFSETGNPYNNAPADYFGDPRVPEAMVPVLDAVNHPDLPTIYGPVAQWGFRFSHWVAPGEVWPWKLLLISAEMAALFMLLKIASPAQALLFAWCPLLVYETAFNAHPEALGVVALVAALVCWKSNRYTGAAIALVVAAAVKPVGGLLIPLMLWRRGLKPWAAAAGAAAVLWGPFVLQGGAAEWAALVVFARHWEFNSSVFGLLTALTSRETSSLLCAIGLAASYMAIVWHSQRGREVPEPVPHGELAYGALFLFSPVVNPWYLAWLVPFVVCRPSGVALSALAASSLSYLYGMNLGDPSLNLYEHPLWLRPLEYGIVAAAAIVACKQWWIRLVGGRSPSAISFAR